MRVVEETASAGDGVSLNRTRGSHGRGLIGWAMGQVSGFVLRGRGEPSVYLVGDSVWCPAVREAIARYGPDVIVANAGAARFNVGAAITMDAPDVLELVNAAPDATVVAVHMEAVNHCGLTRRALGQYLEAHGAAGRVLIPQDGETLILPMRPSSGAR